MIRINDKVFFDTDCLSAFLWTNEMGSLFQLFKNDIVIPKSVYNELCRVAKFQPIIDGAISKKLITVVEMDYKSEEMKIFKQIMFSDSHYKEFGQGEAEVISYAVCNSKEMASNNLSDVEDYIRKFKLINHTIPDILDMMLAENIKTESEIEIMWLTIINRRFRLPYKTYSEYLKHKNK